MRSALRVLVHYTIIRLLLIIILPSGDIVRDTVDASFDPMFTLTETGIIVVANQAAVDIFGYTLEELVGQDISMLCGGDHGPRHDQYMKAYLETGRARVIGKQRVVLARKKDGSEFPVELGVKEIYEEGQRFFCGFMKDVSAQQKHELELQHRESLMQGMINASFDPMFEIDKLGLIRVVNDAATHMFGWSRDEFIGTQY